MNEFSPDINTTVVKLKTDKPVRKTPYQVKGVFIKKHPDELITPMLDGSFRKKFSYPRVQVKILDEQIYIIGVNEGVEAVLAIPDKIKELDFGNITFDISDFEIETSKQQFISSGSVINYSFLTPWAALNHVTAKQYRSTPYRKKASYLNRLLGSNLIFLAKEMGISMEKGLYIKVKIPNLHPKSIDDNKWKAFKGDFKTNILLPSYIGLGNGITRGYGTISCLSNLKSISFDKEPVIEEINEMEFLLPKDLIRQKKKVRSKKTMINKKSRFKKEVKANGAKANRKKFSSRNKNSHSNSNRKNSGSKRIFSEEFDVIIDGNVATSDQEIDTQDDQRFNTERYHKKQHKF